MMIKEIQTEIDKDIINDLRIAAGQPPIKITPPKCPSYQSLELGSVPIRNYTMKATWSIDNSVRVQILPTIFKSTLISKS